MSFPRAPTSASADEMLGGDLNSLFIVGAPVKLNSIS